jgi:2-keto-4-pentenoate hydratase/2-oxohepta-3-ene-1,7-dioic acid hydratase in catechol pathway
MRIASLRPNELAVVKDGSFVAIGDALAKEGALPKGASMVDLIARYDAIKGSIAKAAESSAAAKLDPKQLLAPVARPSKIWAAASNYKRGSTGIDSAAGRGAATTVAAEDLLEMIFLKPPSAVIGPEEAILIPPNVGGVYPELELCAVIGKQCRNLSKDQALDAVFGYTVILDMTARSSASVQAGLVGSRCVRKGYDTFAPIGPWIATRDEIPDPQALLMQAWVNGELRQSAKTDGMINSVVDLVSYLSRVSTLYPGDLISTGNPDAPDFQKALAPGDTIKVEIEKIGAMNLYVQAAKA